VTNFHACCDATFPDFFAFQIISLSYQNDAPASCGIIMIGTRKPEGRSDRFAAPREARAKGGQLGQWKVFISRSEGKGEIWHRTLSFSASDSSVHLAIPSGVPSPSWGVLIGCCSPNEAELYDEFTDDQYRSIVGTRH